MLFFRVFAKIQSASLVQIASCQLTGLPTLTSPATVVSYKPFPLDKCERSDLSPLESPLTAKLRVLPVFGRNHHSLSSLKSTHTGVPVSVDSKELTVKLTPLDATLTKNVGVGGTTFNP
jgi:hypothetical protein